MNIDSGKLNQIVDLSKAALPSFIVALKNIGNIFVAVFEFIAGLIRQVIESL
jgi:hypothetical protein